MSNPAVGGNVKRHHLNINCNSLFGSTWRKIVQHHWTRLDFLTQTTQCIQHGMCRGQCEKSSLEYKSQFLMWLNMMKDRAKSFNKIGFSYTDKEGDIYWFSIMVEIYQWVKIWGCSGKKYWTKFHPSQRRSDTNIRIFVPTTLVDDVHSVAGGHIRLFVYWSCYCAVAFSVQWVFCLHLVVVLHMQSLSGLAQLFSAACVHCWLHLVDWFC